MSIRRWFQLSLRSWCFLLAVVLCVGAAISSRYWNSPTLDAAENLSGSVFTRERIRDAAYVEARIGAGLDPNTFNDSPTNQDSLLTYAVRNNAEATIAKLLEHGAQVDVRSKGLNKTPLFQAAFQGDLNVVKLLLAHGADVQSVDMFGNNALREAIAAGHADIVQSLLDAGCDPRQRNVDGKTMLDIANEHGSSQIKALMAKAARPSEAPNN